MARPAYRTIIGLLSQKSNKPTKTKKAMKTKKFLSMAALALVGAMMTGCSSDDDILQPENKNNLVTLTTTVGFDDAAGTTRALSSTGVKTFAAGETMAIYYWKNKGNDHVKAVSAPLTAGDITNGGKSATFTFTLDNPYKDMSVVYTYPAAMANADFTPNYDALYNNQDGTRATLASDFDFCTKSGAWAGDNLPSLTLENQLAILAITLKNAGGSSDITSGITGLTLSDGTYTYNVSRSAAAGPIYVAIRPTSDATITVTATDGTKNYTKTLTTKTYEAGNGYSVSWRMTQAAAEGHALSASAVGEIVGSDGKAYAAADKDNLPTGVTAVAIIAYVGSATGEASPYNHGLAIAMKDAAAGVTVKWSSSDNDESLDNYTDYSPAVTTAQSGLSNSQTSGFDNETNYPAFYAALHNTIMVSDGISAAAPASGTSGWFLPSLYQWNKIVQGLSGKTADLSHGGNANNNYTASSLNPKIEAAGGTGLQSYAYWPSTEYGNSSAWYFYTGNGSVGYRNKTGEGYVRAVFAF